MGLLQQQQAILRLMLEPRLSDEFFLDPAALSWELGLSPEEAQALATLRLPDVHMYQRMIQAKWITAQISDLGVTRSVAGPLMMEQVLAMARAKPMHRNEWPERVVELESRVLSALEPTDPRAELVRFERTANLLIAQRRAGNPESVLTMRQSIEYEVMGLFQFDQFLVNVVAIDPAHLIIPKELESRPRLYLLYLAPSETSPRIYELDVPTWTTLPRVLRGETSADELTAEVWSVLLEEGIVVPAIPQ